MGEVTNPLACIPSLEYQRSTLKSKTVSVDGS